MICHGLYGLALLCDCSWPDVSILLTTIAWRLFLNHLSASISRYLFYTESELQVPLSYNPKPWSLHTTIFLSLNKIPCSCKSFLYYLSSLHLFFFCVVIWYTPASASLSAWSLSFWKHLLWYACHLCLSLPDLKMEHFSSRSTSYCTVHDHSVTSAGICVILYKWQTLIQCSENEIFFF